MKGETLASPTHVCRLDEVEDFRCDVTRLPSARNPLRDLAEGDGLAASTGDLGAEGRREGRASAGSPSRKKSRFGRDAHAVAVAAASTPPPLRAGADGRESQPSAPIGRPPDARRRPRSPTFRGGGYIPFAEPKGEGSLGHPLRLLAGSLRSPAWGSRLGSA